MDSYNQILCRLQKSMRKVPPPLLLSNEKPPFTHPKEDFVFLPVPILPGWLKILHLKNLILSYGGR